MKKIKSISLGALVMLVALSLLVACGENSNNKAESSQKFEAPTRGAWIGNTWTSDYLGFSLTLPTAWVASSDADIAEALNISAETIEALGMMLPEYIPFLTDMMAVNYLTGAFVQISFERLNPLIAGATSEEYTELTAQTIEMLNGTAYRGLAPIQIGNYMWERLNTRVDLGDGTIMYGNHLFNVIDDLVRMIVISCPVGHSTGYDILNSID